MNQKHRYDIDLLRCIAVLAVVVFHLDPELLPLGFYGVDIFFVITGYLITAQLMHSVGNDSFSFYAFYRNRILRLMPMQIFVIFCTLLVAFFIVDTFTYISYAKSAISSLLNVSNLYFLVSVDYFDDYGRHEPFLHTWSLSLEEQFYLLYPVILVASKKFFDLKASIILLFAIALIFVGVSHMSLNNQTELHVSFIQSNLDTSSLIFYTLPFRAFEILFGAIAFVFTKNINLPRGNILNFVLVAVIIPLSLVIAFSINLSNFTIQLILCFLVALALTQDQSSLFKNKIFSPFRWIGTISYSLYLVHWPIITLLVYLNFSFNTYSSLSLFVIMVLISSITYHCIEQFFRKRG